MEQQIEQLAGTVERIVYQSTDNGFVVFALNTQYAQTTTVTGHFPQITPGAQVTLSGTWTSHPRFGKQFDARTCLLSEPTSRTGIVKYLGSGLIRGIGPSYAEKMVGHFGDNVLEIIDKHPERLHEVSGIGIKRAESIATAWVEQRAVAHIMIFLQEKGVSPAYAAKIYKKYGVQAVEVITQNPYRLADEVWGIGFKMADQIAQNMGFERASSSRVAAGILYALNTHAKNGHLYATVDELKKISAQLLELEPETDEINRLLKWALHEQYDAKKIRLLSVDDKHFVGLRSFADAEQGVAQSLQTLTEHRSTLAIDLQKLFRELRLPDQRTSQELNEDQQRGVLASLEHKISIVTGGPGTGKTTLIARLLNTLQGHNIRTALAAPTGRAAKRMQESTRTTALTIHRLLEFDVGTMRFTRDERNALPVDFVIIDEASMIDITLANALLKAMPRHAHILFIGDIHQLPSVGAGNFLRDLIASELVPCTTLTHIFRQAQDSLIVVNAHRINNGEFPTTQQENTRRDFLFIKEPDPANLPSHLKHILKNGLHRFSLSHADMITLTPMNRGLAGTHQLNHILQEMLNPGDERPVMRIGATTFRIGDRVMQLRNNYDNNVFNGDIGTIETIDAQDGVLNVRYQERLIPYEQSDLDELTLAYSISIHKSQGSEYPAVVVPLFMQHFVLLQRNLVYTALTRAKKLCIFIGEPRALGMAIKNNTGTQRTTLLHDLLKGKVVCR